MEDNSSNQMFHDKQKLRQGQAQSQGYSLNIQQKLIHQHQLQQQTQEISPLLDQEEPHLIKSNQLSVKPDQSSSRDTVNINTFLSALDMPIRQDEKVALEENQLFQEQRDNIEGKNKIDLESLEKRKKAPPYTFESGAIYTGQSLGALQDGFGVQKWPNGTYYDGHWAQNKLQGRGKVIYENGDLYEGNIQDGKKNGQGICFTTQGDWYEGYWKDDYQHGQGFEAYQDGSKYDGYFKKGQKNGNGTILFADGAQYNGNCENDCISGFGILTWPDGKKYEGNWLDNKMHGWGIYTWPEGCRYEGEHELSTKHGYGVYFWEDGSRKYEGFWISGKQHGLGKYSTKEQTRIGRWEEGNRIGWIKQTDFEYQHFFKLQRDVIQKYLLQQMQNQSNSNDQDNLVKRISKNFGSSGKREKAPPYKFESGAIYTGQWLGALRDGFGVQKWPNGDQYEGHWLQNKQNGKGKLIKSDGDVYEGNFQDDKMDGDGFYFASKGDLYHGQFKEDEKNGNGTLLFPDGAIYTGNWENDEIFGFGVYTWSKGIRYEGNWLDNKMHGWGIQTWPDGSRYEGEYVSDKKHGYGVFFWANGYKKHEGFWIDGKQHGLGKLSIEEDFKIGRWKEGHKIAWIELTDLEYQHFFKLRREKILQYQQYQNFYQHANSNNCKDINDKDNIMKTVDEHYQNSNLQVIQNLKDKSFSNLHKNKFINNNINSTATQSDNNAISGNSNLEANS